MADLDKLADAIEAFVNDDEPATKDTVVRDARGRMWVRAEYDLNAPWFSLVFHTDEVWAEVCEYPPISVATWTEI